MKNLTRVFMAVAALFAYACTTDATEDLGVQLGNNGGQTLTLSLEESRTQLGEKADGVYPLYWSEGDKIAVNGVASGAAQIDNENKAKAVFSFESEVTHPYNIVYPAPAANAVAVTEGTVPVTFAAVQHYTADTFESGVAPMYGYTVSGGATINMQHLTGVLRFAPKGEGITLTSMTISSAKGKIAGNFDVNCESGTLTAQADATNVITVTFGNGLTLGTEATPIYVAVPAGEYGEFEVLLSSTTGAMLVKFNSDGEKAIKAGIVREFTEFTYESNTTISDIFEIYDEATLRQFAMLAPNFAPRKGAKVTASIDMTGKEWTPIEDFGGYTFDGGKNDGFEIKGLSAPLFATTSATIKNVNLVDVNIVETERKFSGSLVCILNGGSASNCSVSGKYTYNKTTDTMAGGIWAEFAAGSLIGKSINAALNDLSSSVDFSIVSICAGIKTKAYPAFGGVIGAIENSEDYITAEDSSITMLETPVYSNLSNSGMVSYDGVHGATKVQPIIAGTIGHARYATLTNGSNSGEVKVNKHAYCIYLGGVIGGTHGVNLDTIENTGSITIDAQISWPYLGGVIGQINGSSVSRTITAVNNRGKFTTTKNSYLDSNAAIGGVLGVASSGCSTTMTNCHNHGELDIDGKADVVVKETRIGGLIGSSVITLAENCTNNATVTVKISSADTKVGGIAGIMQSTAAATIQNCTNNGKVEVTSQQNTKIMLGGVVGYNKTGTLKNVTNAGEVICSGSTISSDAIAGRAYVGGVVGASEYALTGLKNQGTVTISESANFVGLCFGGAVGYCAAAVTSSSNSGVVTYSGTTNMLTALNAAGEVEENGNEVFCVGGVLGWSAKGGNKNLTNEATGTLNVGGKFTASLTKKYGYTAIAGVAGRLSSGNHSKIYNKAAVNISSDIPNASWNEEPFPIGGVIGYATGNLTDIGNSGNITYSGKCISDEPIRLSGVYGRGSNDDVDTYTNISNTGTITVSGTSDDHILVSGINAYNTNSTYNNIVNKGNIIITETAATNETLYVAGCFAAPKDTMTATGPVCNSGNITIKGSGKAVYVGGCARGHSAVAMNTYVNTGNITVVRPEGATFPVYVGGVVSNATANIANAKCHCNIQASGEGITVGWITSTLRSGTVVATNCEIAGVRVDHWDDSDIELRPVGDEITTGNFQDFIYGGVIDWSGITNYDGCKYLESKPTIQ